MKKSLLIFLLQLLVSSVLANTNIVREGVYYGFIKMQGQTEKIPTLLYIVKDQTSDSEGEHIAPMLAYLKIQLGGFSSHEYETFSYRIPDYRWNSSRITLDSNSYGKDSKLNMRAVFSDGGKKLSGSVMPLNTGFVMGEIKLVYHEKGKPKKVDLSKTENIIEGIAGDYTGKCSNESYKLQLMTIRYQSSMFNDSAIHPGLMVTGRLYKPARRMTDYKKNNSVNFYAQKKNLEINMFTQTISLPVVGSRCKFGKGTITCSETCSFTKDIVLNSIPVTIKKLKEDPLEPILFDKDCHIHSRKSNIDEVINAPSLQKETYEGMTDFKESLIEGRYFGNLHFEGRDIYRPMGLIVDLTGEPQHDDLDNPVLSQRVASLTAMMLPSNKKTGSGVISLGFEARELPKANLKNIVFYGHEDFDLKIEDWTEKGIFGIVLSKAYGRIGTFQLKKYSTMDSLLGATDANTLYNIESSFKFYYKQETGKEEHLTVNLSLSKGPYSNGAPTPSYFPFEIRGNIRTYVSLNEIDYGITGYFDPYSSVVLLDISDGKMVYGKYLGPAGLKGSMLGKQDVLNSIYRPLKTR